MKEGLDAIYKIQLRLAAKEEELRKEQEERAAKDKEKRVRKAESSLNTLVAVLSLLAFISAFVDARELLAIIEQGKTSTALSSPFFIGANIVLNVIIIVIFACVVNRMIKLHLEDRGNK